MRRTEPAGVERHRIWVPREPVCKAGEGSPEDRGTRPSPISLVKRLKLGACRGQSLSLKHCAAPRVVQDHWAELSGSASLQMGGVEPEKSQ